MQLASRGANVTYNGNVYTVKDDRQGSMTITRKYDGASCFLQGDDTIELRESITTLETIVYPTGPFQTFEAHLDAVLDAYESVIR